MKISNDTIGNRTRDLPACSAVPHLTAPPRAPSILYHKHNIPLIIMNIQCMLINSYLLYQLMQKQVVYKFILKLLRHVLVLRPYYLSRRPVGRARQPYYIHVPTVLKSGSLNLLETSRPVQACNGIAFLLLTFKNHASYI